MTCSCGRAEVEPGMDLCAYCRADYDQRQHGREEEAAFYADQERAHQEWLNEQGPGGSLFASSSEVEKPEEGR